MFLVKIANTEYVKSVFRGKMGLTQPICWIGVNPG